MSWLDNIKRPGISIRIDDCSWGNPARISHDLMYLVTVALTVHVKNPPVILTHFELYIEGSKQKLIDFEPSVLIQETGRRSYLTKFGVSLFNPGFVVSNNIKKYQLCVVASRKTWWSKKFSPKDFGH